MSGEDLKAFVDGELSGWKRWLVARQVAKSPELQAEVEALRKLSQDLAALDLPDAPLSESLRIRLLSAAPESAAAPIPVTPRRSPTKTVAYGLLGAASLACLAVIFVPRAEKEATSAKASAPAAPVPAAASAEVAKEPPVLSAPMSEANKKTDTYAAGEGAATPADFRADRELMNEAQPGNAIANRVSDSIAVKRRQDALLQSQKAAAPAESAYYGRPNATAKAKATFALKQVIELTASSSEGGRATLRNRVEEAVKSYGGKVLKHEPLEVTLPSTLRGTARQKLVALVEVGPTKELNRAKGIDADKDVSSGKFLLKVTVYFKD